MCGCNGRINGKMTAGGDTLNVVTKIGAAVLAGTVGYKVGEIATQHVEFMKKDPLTSGLIKVGGAIATAALFPDVVSNEWGTGALVGFGTSGGNDLLKAAGINGIGMINQTRYLNGNATSVATKNDDLTQGVRVEYR